MESSSNFESRGIIYPVSYSLVGASYRTVGVEDRERIASIGGDIEDFLPRLKSECGLQEAAVISTCNRFEIVSAGGSERSPDRERTRIAGFMESSLGGSLSNQLYFYENGAAVRHIFRVTSSLDSMVLGEAQVFGQVKESYSRAVKLGCVGKYLHHLFQFAFSLAKKIRSNTALAERGVSISYVAVRLAEQIFGELSDCSAMIIGSGATAELTGLHLKGRGCKNIVVANRTIDRAFELAERLEGSAISLSDISRHLPAVDVVISSVSRVDRPLVEASEIKQMRRARALFLVDLGVPRNLSPLLGQIENVYLYNIDDLSTIVDENKSVREEAAKESEILVDHGLFQFEKWLTKVSAEPAILDFRARMNAVIEGELSDALKNFPHANREEFIGELARRLSQRLSHDVTALLSGLPEGKLDQAAIIRLLLEQYLKII
ncbi:MAG: glutamyl-tRNA reductase [Deltaproteobacteria bacterium]|nr:glutamyl-tRNA reductase [Deltaproteobacteria bacterium]